MEPKDKQTNNNPENAEELKDPKTGKTISRKKAFVLAGGAMLAGTAINDLNSQQDIAEILFDSDGDGLADTVLSDSNADGIYDTSTAIPVESSVSSDPGSQSWNPNTAPMASPGTVTDDMSFGEAFASAREEMGPGGVFVWHGQYYNTFYAEELDDNNQPTVDYATTEYHDLPPASYQGSETSTVQESASVDDIHSGGQEAGLPSGDFEPHVMAVDFDMDGKVDAVLVDINQDGSADIMYSDINQDGVIGEDEFIVINDPSTLQAPETPSDGSMMTVDINADGVDEMLLGDVDGDQLADIVGIDANMNQQMEESEIHILNPAAFEQMHTLEYSGEIATDMPDDVPDEVIDQMGDELSSLEDNFDEINEWT